MDGADGIKSDALQAGGHRFDPSHVHQPFSFVFIELAPSVLPRSILFDSGCPQFCARPVSPMKKTYSTEVVAIGAVTEAQPKRRMGRAGKLEIVLDYVRLAPRLHKTRRQRCRLNPRAHHQQQLPHPLQGPWKCIRLPMVQRSMLTVRSLETRQRR
jgi:hypothetical protein